MQIHSLEDGMNNIVDTNHSDVSYASKSLAMLSTAAAIVAAVNRIDRLDHDQEDSISVEIFPSSFL